MTGPRLALAKIQWLIERGRYKDAAKAISDHGRSGVVINKFVLKDMGELLRLRFSMRKLYELDYT